MELEEADRWLSTNYESQNIVDRHKGVVDQSKLRIYFDI